MSIFRFSAKFRFFFFLLSAFLKMIFRVFWKITTTTKNCFRLPTLPLSTVRRASVNTSVTSWFAGMHFFRFRSKCRISTRHSKSDARGHAACRHTACTASTRRRGGRWFIELQHLHPLLFHPHHFTHAHVHTQTHTHTHTHTHTYTHTHALSLSLSLSLTYTDIQGCQLLRFRGSMLRSLLACYTRTKNAMVT